MAEQIEYKGYTIKIKGDSDGESPRDWDNAGKMVCWHNRYNLGDEQPKMDPREWLQAALGMDDLDYESKRYQFLDNASINELLKEFSRDNVVLPLILYDHSGITMSTYRKNTWQHASWDSGQVGWIYISHKDAVKEWGNKLFTAAVREKAEKYLQGEVEIYNQYLTGDVYGYIITQNGEMVDSCWGFYGYQYCIDEAKSLVNDYSTDKAGAQWLQLANTPACCD